MSVTDAQLVRSALGGDQQAFSGLVDRYKYAVYGVCLSVLSDFDLAEDMAQEAFIKAYQQLSNLNGGARFGSWLRIIAVNECRLHLRRRRPVLSEVDTPALDGPVHSLPADQQAERLEQQAEQGRLEQATLLAMHRLPEDNRQALTLYYMGGHTIKEIGRFFGTTAQTMKMRIHRARKQLQKEAHRMVKDTLEKRGLGPDFKDRIKIDTLTVMFTDVAGFAFITEQLPAEEWMDLLYEYLSEMTDIVLKYDGTLARYDCDSIMAYFGAAPPCDDHAVKACLAALDMQTRLTELREKWKQEGKPALHQKIGVNTGQMAVGNMGSRQRDDFTVVGDEVNLAWRLEGVNKEYGTETLISRSTYGAAQASIEAREVGAISPFKQSIGIYELLARKGELDVEKAKVVDLFQQGLEHYRQRRWDNEAINRFNEALEIDPDDGPSAAYILKCENHLLFPPPENIPSEEVDGLEIQEDTDPVVRYVNLVLLRALQTRTGKIRFEPGEKTVTIKYGNTGRSERPW